MKFVSFPVSLKARARACVCGESIRRSHKQTRFGSWPKMLVCELSSSISLSLSLSLTREEHILRYGCAIRNARNCRLQAADDHTAKPIRATRSTEPILDSTARRRVRSRTHTHTHTCVGVVAMRGESGAPLIYVMLIYAHPR